MLLGQPKQSHCQPELCFQWTRRNAGERDLEVRTGGNGEEGEKKIGVGEGAGNISSRKIMFWQRYIYIQVIMAFFV